MTTVVFVGPTLSVAAARALAPDAILLPPARQGDVLTALTRHAPDSIGLIDGAFGQVLAVWHKELLEALARGVTVVGAASMGALRAAELAPFGMVGIGAVYARARRGELVDDDEVAVLHGDAETGFRSLTLPLVNLRATLAHLAGTRRLGAAESARLLSAAQALHFSERTLDRICTRADLDESRRPLIEARLRGAAIDLKAADARQLLRALASGGYRGTRSPAIAGPSSWAFERLRDSDRRIARDGIEMPLRAVAVQAALTLEDFETRQDAALNRALVLVLADLWHVAATPAEIDAEARRFRRRRALDTPGALAAWLAAHDLRSDEFRDMLSDLARCRRLQRWIQHQPRPGRGTPTRWLLDELRLQDRYRDAVAAARAQAAALAPWPGDHDGLAELSPTELVELVTTQQQAAGWHPTAPLAEWAADAGFDDLQELAYELLRARRARAAGPGGPPVVGDG